MGRAPDALLIMGEGKDALTLSGTQYSDYFSVADCDVWAVHAEWTGTPTATITLWASCKPEPDTANDTDWVQVTSFTGISPAGSASKALVEVGNSGAKYYRLKSVLGAGAGTMKMWAHGKANR